MKIRSLLAYILSLVMLLTLFGIPAAATQEDEADLTVTNGSHGIDAAMPYMGTNKLVDRVKSVFMYETNSDTLLYSWNADTQIHPASLVKVMTALVVLENCDLQQMATATKTALSSITNQDIAINLEPGEQMSVEDLLYAMLVYAANDAAVVLAEHTSGSVEAFVEQMNIRAQELGCTGSVFMNPHGLHHDQQYMTARDVCRIILAALEHEVFRTIFCTEYYTIPATNMSDERRIVTNNYLINADFVAIYLDHRVKGGRTGVSQDSRRNIASLSEVGDMEVVCVVMGAESVIASNGYSVDVYGGFPETISLLDQAYSNTARRQIICADQILKRQTVVNGDHDVFYVCRETFTTVLPAEYTLDELDFRYTEVPGSLNAPITKGQNMAYLQVWHGNRCLAETEVYAANDVPLAYSKAGNMHRVGRIGLILLILFLVIALPVIAVFGVLLYMRYSAQKKHRSRKKDRRRS